MRKSYRGIRRYSRAGRRPGRRSRWVVVVGGPTTVAPGTYQTIDLLSPAQPAPTFADLTYQTMTKPTVIAIMGHMTLGANDTYTVPGTNLTKQCEYGWGIYRDVDITSSTTDLPAYSAGFSNSWMVHKTGTLSQPFLIASNTTDQSYAATAGATDLQYRRYDLNLRRYKRTLDSLNDTLILSVENGSSPGSGTCGLAFTFYFRMLLLE